METARKHYEYRTLFERHSSIVKKLTREVEKLNEIAEQTNANENVKAQIININKVRNELLDFCVTIFDTYHLKKY